MKFVIFFELLWVFGNSTGVIDYITITEKTELNADISRH